MDAADLAPAGGFATARTSAKFCDNAKRCVSNQPNRRGQLDEEETRTHCETNQFVRNAMDKNKEEKNRHALEELVEKGN